jgi:thioredoxin reductase
MSLHEALIIGAGPAGMSAALQLKRYRVDYVLFEKARLGGLLHNANLVENYPGFPGGIPGPALVELFERQLLSAGVSVRQGEVHSLSYDEGKFHLAIDDDEYKAGIAVVASGTRPRLFSQLEIPAALRSRVYYEIAPLLHLEGKRIVIVGGGDAAFDYALNLGKKNKVIVLNRSENVRCLPLLWERMQAAEGISYHPNAELVSVMGEADHGLILSHTSKDGIQIIQADYLIGALGREACCDFITPELTAKSEELQKRGMLYFIGDVKNAHYRQTAIATGDGILAAMRIYEMVRKIQV